jgi:hypothetical protein
MSAMTRPDTSSKILLVADRRPDLGSGSPGPVRRFRLARLRHQPRAEAVVAPQMKRV